MFPFGHLGLTLALAVGARRWLGDFRLDYRLLLVASLLPDLVDKPLSVAFGIGGRSIAHTLLVVLALTLLFVLVRRPFPPPDRRVAWAAALLAVTIGSGTHLLLDRMWTQPEVLLWPFLGLTFPLDSFDPFRILEGYRDPYVLLGDIVGAAALGALAWRYGMFRLANLLRFGREGHLARREAPATRWPTSRAGPGERSGGPSDPRTPPSGG